MWLLLEFHSVALPSDFLSTVGRVETWIVETYISLSVGGYVPVLMATVEKARGITATFFP